MTLPLEHWDFYFYVSNRADRRLDESLKFAPGSTESCAANAAALELRKLAVDILNEKHIP